MKNWALVMSVAAVVFGAIAMAAGVWVYRRRKWRQEESEELAWKRRTKCAALEVAREFLRAKLLAGGENRHYAYHVAGDGLILRVDAEAFYLALFARIHDFWELVAGQVVTHVGSLAVGMNEINRIDGECDFTCIYSRCGKTYIDAIFPRYLPYPYKATWMTAEEFKQAIVDAKAKAAKRSRGDNNFKDGFESIHA